MFSAWLPAFSSASYEQAALEIARALDIQTAEMKAPNVRYRGISLLGLQVNGSSL